MPIFDSEDGLVPSTGPTDEQVVAYFRRYLPDFYFVNAPLSRMRRQLQLLQNLPHQPVQMPFFRPPGANFTELILCARDEAQPGLLAKVAGTLAAVKINVHTAWIHTLINPHDGGEGHVVPDTLILSETSLGRMRALTPKTQKKVSTALNQVLQTGANASCSLIPRRAQGPIHVHDLSATEAGEWTLIKLSAQDDSGVLYRVTQALAALELHVAHAQINTFEKAVDDVFFVSSPRGGLLSPVEMPAMLNNLREMLMREGSPSRE